MQTFPMLSVVQLSLLKTNSRPVKESTEELDPDGEDDGFAGLGETPNDGGEEFRELSVPGMGLFVAGSLLHDINRNTAATNEQIIIIGNFI